MSVSNSPFSEIVGRHLYGNAITGENSNAVTAELASKVSQNRSILIQLHTEQPGGELFNHCSCYFNTIFFTHSPPEIGMRIVQTPRGARKIRYLPV